MQCVCVLILGLVRVYHVYVSSSLSLVPHVCAISLFYSSTSSMMGDAGNEKMGCREGHISDFGLAVDS